MENMHPLYTAEDIRQKVAALGAEITRDYEKILKPGERLLMVGVLNGAFIFMADLVRTVNLLVDVDFIRLSSYQDGDVSLGTVVMTKNMETKIINRHVVVVEDIVDSGLTMSWVLKYFQAGQAASVKVAVAIDKRTRRDLEINLDYVGFTSHDGFLVGYGLDHAGAYRNLPGIYQVVTQPGGSGEGVL